MKGVAFTTLVACAAMVLALIGWANNHTRLDDVERLVLLHPTGAAAAIVVHVDPVAGSDARAGTTPASAVRSFERAAALLAQTSAPLGVIRVSAGTLDLGANPTLQLGSLVRQYGAIRVEGERQSVLRDTVAAVSVQNPLSTGWYQIAATAGGYVTDAYARHFISNDDMKRVYVVESNTGNTVNTIAGTAGPAASQSVYLPLPVGAAPWTVGERFTLFRVGATVITWTGQLSLDIPFNVITFDSVWMNPSVADSRLRAPDGPEHRVVFDACIMTLQSASGTLPSFMGSMLMRGVYAAGAVPSAVLTGYQRNRCIMTESLWVDNDIGLIYTGACAAFWVKSTNSLATIPIQVGSAADKFYGSGLEITGHTSRGFLVSGASIAVVEGLRIVRNVGAVVAGYQIATDVETQSVFRNVDVECVPQTLCVCALNVQEGTKTSLEGHVRMIAASLILFGGHGALDVQALLSWQVVPPNPYGAAPIRVANGAHLSLNPGMVIPLSTVGTSFPIVSVVGGRADFIGPAAFFQWSTNSGATLVSVQRAGVVSTTDGLGVNGMNVSNFNYGPVATDVIKCGANAISAWAVSENDYGAVGSQNCACAR